MPIASSIQTDIKSNKSVFQLKSKNLFFPFQMGKRYRAVNTLGYEFYRNGKISMTLL